MRPVYKFVFGMQPYKIMVQYPNNSVRLVGTWEALKLLCKLGFTERKLNHVVYINGVNVSDRLQTGSSR